jgi:hypothetical protein
MQMSLRILVVGGCGAGFVLLLLVGATCAIAPAQIVMEVLSNLVDDELIMRRTSRS